MLRMSYFIVGLVVVLAAAPSWGIMVSGPGSPVAADADAYSAAGSGGVSILSAAFQSGGGTTFVVPVPTFTPPPDMTPIPPTPPPNGPVVPEPGTIALVGLGVLGIAAARRRRRA